MQPSQLSLLEVLEEHADEAGVIDQLLQLLRGKPKEESVNLDDFELLVFKGLALKHAIKVISEILHELLVRHLRLLGLCHVSKDTLEPVLLGVAPDAFFVIIKAINNLLWGDIGGKSEGELQQ